MNEWGWTMHGMVKSTGGGWVRRQHADDLLESLQKLVNEIDWTINNVAIAGQYQHLKGLFAACSEAREAIARATDSRP